MHVAILEPYVTIMTSMSHLGLFEWSMAHQDGTQPARPLPESERLWLEEAMKASMIDLGKRMEEIKESLDAHSAEERRRGERPAELEEAERLLDELQDIVETIDAARDLASIGGLDTLADLLTSPEPSIRSRAAEVGATCVQNSPEVQDRFLDHSTYAPRVLDMLRTDTDATCRVKALLALSCQVRGHAPSTSWFKAQGGLELLANVLQEDSDARARRKAAQLLTALLPTTTVAERQGLLRKTTTGDLLGSAGRLLGDAGDDAGREAVAELVLAIAASPEGAAAVWNCAELREGVQSALARLDALPREDWDAAREEADALKALAKVLSGTAAAPQQPEEQTAPTLLLTD